MQQNYKRLGDYIRLVDVRNKNLDVQTLLGVSIQKKLMPSIANTVGTDMSNYKVIQRNQFAYGTVTSRNGDKISIALLKEFEKAIVSQIYLVFEIKDTAELLPDYLMMWFRRPEFDRYARYKSHGSARETFDWNEMIETKLPIPSIEKQKELVTEYQTIENRIRLNNELCQKLEETAQTVYRHWFEDFEFPVIARSEAQQNDEAISTNQILQVAESTAEYQNRSELVAEQSRWVAERSRSYKSSGGEMVYSEELGKEIPKGWRVEPLEKIAKIKGGKRLPKGEELNSNFNGNPYIKVANMSKSKFLCLDTSFQYVDHETQKIIGNYIVSENDLIISIVGTIGLVSIIDQSLTGANLTENCFRIFEFKEITSNYLFSYLNSSAGKNEIITKTVGGVQGKLPMYNVESFKILIPEKTVLKEFEICNQPINSKLINLTKQNQKLEELKSLLLGKMAVEE